MREPIENEYFNWLCAKVLDTNVRIYFDLMSILHRTEFIWVHPQDKNRAEDGLELRTDFLRETMSKSDSYWLNNPCSVLEMLIAFSKRASFQTDFPVRDWFWDIMRNLNLDGYRQVSISDAEDIEQVLHFFVSRTYDRSGQGGMFPMRRPMIDQREVEIWYQFMEYLEDRGLD